MRLTLVFRAEDSDFSSDRTQRDNRLTRGCLVDVLKGDAHPGSVIVASPKWRVVRVDNPPPGLIEDLLTSEVIDAMGNVRPYVRGRESPGEPMVVKVTSKRTAAIDLNKLEKDAEKGGPKLSDSDEIVVDGSELAKLVKARVSRRQMVIR